jgi:hypothetical protein
MTRAERSHVERQLAQGARSRGRAGRFLAEKGMS